MIDSAKELFFEGNRLMQAGKALIAENCFRNVIKIDPDFSEAWANLGYLRAKVGDDGYAENCFLKSIALSPDLEPAHLMLGVLLMNLKRFAESEHRYREYLSQHQNSKAAWSNLGVLLACLKREDEAEQCYRRALAIDSHYKNASFSLSYLLLRQQRWKEGWLRLEDRWQYPLLEKHFTCARWRGDSLFDKSLIIGFEMGHGDMIFYSRYIRELRAQGARRLAMICHPGLKKLFGTLAGLDQLYSLDDEVPATGWDYWTPCMSLPHYCLTRSHNIPAHIPYLFADSARVQHWQARLPQDGLRVGLVWKGNPQFENDADRSIPSLLEFQALADLPGVHFIGLQKGQGDDDIGPLGMDYVALGSQFNDFADTAAVLQCLDLVISVDTAVAHLAGAMGKSCWVLLPDYRCDWRWQADGDATPWYPEKMRLFRQPSGGGWAPVMRSLRIELTALIKTKSSLDSMPI